MGEYWGARVSYGGPYAPTGYFPAQSGDIDYSTDGLTIEDVYQRVMNQHPEDIAALADQWVNVSTVLNNIRSHLLQQSNLLYNESWRSAEARDAFMEFGPGKTLAYLDEWIAATDSNVTALRHVVNIATRSRTAMQDMWDRYEREVEGANDASGWDKTREWVSGFGFGYDGNMMGFLTERVNEVKERFNREARQLATDTGNEYFTYLSPVHAGHGPVFRPMNAVLNAIGAKPPLPTTPSGPAGLTAPNAPAALGAPPPPPAANPTPGAPPQLQATVLPGAPGMPPAAPGQIAAAAPLAPAAPVPPGLAPGTPPAPLMPGTPPPAPIAGIPPALPGVVPLAAPGAGLVPSAAPGLPPPAPGTGAGAPPPAPARPSATPPGLRDGVLGRGQPNLPPGAALPPGRTLRRPGSPGLGPGQNAPGSPGAPAGPTSQGARPPGAATPAVPPGAPRRGSSRPGTQQPGMPGSAAPPGTPGARQPGSPARPAARQPGSPGFGTPTLPPGRPGPGRPGAPGADEHAPGGPVDSAEAFAPPPAQTAPPVLRAAQRPDPRRPGGPHDLLPFRGRGADDAAAGETAPPVLGRPQRADAPRQDRGKSGAGRQAAGQPVAGNEWIGADAARAEAGAPVLDAPTRAVSGAKVSRLEEVPRQLRGRGATSPAPAGEPPRRGVAPELAARRSEATPEAARPDDQPTIVTDEQAFGVETPGGGVLGKKPEDRSYRPEPPTALGGN